MRTITVAVTIATGIGLFSAALGQESGADRPVGRIGPSGAELADRLPKGLVNDLARRPEQARRRLLDAFLQMAEDGVLTRDALVRAERVERTIARSRELQKSHLVGDLNGDGAVTPEERTYALGALDRKYGASFVVFQQRADTDGDGTVSMVEASARADEMVADGQARRIMAPLVFMALDLNDDGNVRLDEVLQAIDRLAEHRLDRRLAVEEARRRPAVVSPPRVDIIRDDDRVASGPVRRPVERSSSPGCIVPTPPEGAEIILLSGYEGGALSTLAVAGQNREAEVTTVRIEPGTQPLWILASSFKPMLWRLEGATDRVATFVVEAQIIGEGPREGQVAAAVAGLDAEKVRFLTTGSCAGSNWKEDPVEQRLFAVQAARRLGFEPGRVATRYRMGTVTLPRAHFEEPERLPHPDIYGMEWKISVEEGLVATGQRADPRRLSVNTIMMLRRFYPGGVIAVDPDTVVAQGPVEPYEILPNQAGLLQLIQSGALRPIDRETFVIEKPIPHFPVSLNGVHRTRFILAEGVPVPEGRVRGATILSAETGECLSGPQCRR